MHSGFNRQWFQTVVPARLMPLIAHESEDGRTVHLRISRLIGGEDPTATLSSMHREIYRLGRVIDRPASEDTPDGAALKDLRRTL